LFEDVSSFFIYRRVTLLVIGEPVGGMGTSGIQVPPYFQ
jgi:hypothetical protein